MCTRYSGNSCLMSTHIIEELIVYQIVCTSESPEELLRRPQARPSKSKSLEQEFLVLAAHWKTQYPVPSSRHSDSTDLGWAQTWVIFCNLLRQFWWVNSTALGLEPAVFSWLPQVILKEVVYDRVANCPWCAQDCPNFSTPGPTFQGIPSSVKTGTIAFNEPLLEKHCRWGSDSLFEKSPANIEWKHWLSLLT